MVEMSTEVNAGPDRYLVTPRLGINRFWDWRVAWEDRVHNVADHHPDVNADELRRNLLTVLRARRILSVQKWGDRTDDGV